MTNLIPGASPAPSSGGMLRVMNNTQIGEMQKQQQEFIQNWIKMSMQMWMPMLNPPRDRK